MENTEKQISRILADAEINGIHAAARSAGVPWQTVLRWARERNLNIPSRKHISARKRAEKANPETNKESPELSQAKAENAALKKRVKQLEEEIRKLRKAIMELI